MFPLTEESKEMSQQIKILNVILLLSHVMQFTDQMVNTKLNPYSYQYRESLLSAIRLLLLYTNIYNLS